MTRRKKGKVNKTERLQILYRNRWGCFGPPVEPRLIVQDTPVRGDPKRRAKYRAVTEEHRRRLKPR